MVGMGAIVGGATGAAMTAVTMIFEMTRDYGIVMPMIIAVALSFGVRRLLSRASVYTLKLIRRGHPVPEVRHANMFLVHPAREVMQKDFSIYPVDTDLAELLRQFDGRDSMIHILASRGDRIVGAIRINLALRHGLAGTQDRLTLGDVVNRRFNLVREEDVMFDVIARLARKRATIAVVVKGRARATRENVVGVITKEHVAESVFTGLEGYR
jgi:CIC family chloride channel protein